MHPLLWDLSAGLKGRHVKAQGAALGKLAR